MLLSDFDFPLPENLIAQTPLADRTSSRLLVLDRKTGSVRHKRFIDLADLLRSGDLLVLNDSRVIPARLPLSKTVSGFDGEILLLSERKNGEWETLVRPGKKFPIGATVDLGFGLLVSVVSIDDDGVRTLSPTGGDLRAFADKNGEMPLPPYIDEKLSDKNRYQTTYAADGASVAAPTAGLHFSDDFLNALRKKGVETAFVRLDVGLGTFRPVKTERIEDHKMHAEFFSVSPETAAAVNRAKTEGRRIIAVGTTAVRVLESIADENGCIAPQSGETSIFITPGFRFRTVDALLTNFHLPKSTLLMLVSAFATRETVLAAYREAVAERYRFFSFGDASFVG